MTSILPEALLRLGGAGSGGSGNDVFAFSASGGSDTIFDWNEGDKLDVSGLGIVNLAGLTLTSIIGGTRVSATGLSADVMLDAGEALDSNDFIFA